MKAASLFLVVALVVAVMLLLVQRGERAAADAAWQAKMDSTTEVQDSVVREARDSLVNVLAQRDSALRLASRTQSRVDTLRVRVRDVQMIPVPDTCAEVVAVRDMLITHYDSAYVAMHRAHQHQLWATQRALRSASAFSAAYDSVRAVVAERPTPRSQWAPRLSADVGIESTGRWLAGLELHNDRIKVFAGNRHGKWYGRAMYSQPLF